MIVAITGITGLLGRNLAFELLQRYQHKLDSLTILALGRSSKTNSLPERVAAMLQDDGRHYLRTDDIRPFLARIRCIDFELEQPGLGMEEAQIKALQKRPIDLFFHLAATVDFRDTPKVAASLREVNLNGTKKAAALCQRLGAGSFVYASTAYVSGYTTGNISPDYVNFDQPFKNPYERSKLEAEVAAREAFSGSQATRLKVFRPSTICGRLLEPLPGQTPKFDVFYAWLAFFLRLKARAQGGQVDYEQTTSLDLRVCYNPQSTLNIIPVDYAAKAMLEAALGPGDEASFHLASPRGALNQWTIPFLFDFINLRLPPLTPKIPDGLNSLERLYYEKAVGLIYTPYIAIEDVQFDLDSLYGVLPAGFPGCPEIDRANLKTLLEYAKQHNFGLS